MQKKSNLIYNSNTTQEFHMDAGFKFRIGGKEYSTDELQTALDRKNITFDNWSGARKIKLGNEQFKYDEILKIVSNTIREQKEQVGHKENNELHLLLDHLVEIKDKGHTNTGVLYTLFRRTIPNMFRERNISNLQLELKEEFPSTNDLREYVEKRNTTINEKNINKYCKGTAKRTIFSAVLIADYFMPKKDELKDLTIDQLQNKMNRFDEEMKKNDSSFRQNIFEIFTDEQLIAYAKYLCPSKDALKTNPKSVDDLYTISKVLGDDKWTKNFSDIPIKKNADGEIFLSYGGKKNVNLSVMIQYRELAEKQMLDQRGSIEQMTIYFAKAFSADYDPIRSATNYIEEAILGNRLLNSKELVNTAWHQAIQKEMAKNETKFIVDKLKEHLEVSPASPRVSFPGINNKYLEYIHYLQNSEETLNFAQVALLTDYLAKNRPVNVANSDMWNALERRSPSSVGRYLISEYTRLAG